MCIHIFVYMYIHMYSLDGRVLLVLTVVAPGRSDSRHHRHLVEATFKTATVCIYIYICT